MPPSPHRLNIMAAWDAVTDADRGFGARAYPMYHAAMRRFAKAYGAGFVQTVEAFVALSPSSDYHGNLRSLASVLQGARDGLPVDQITVSTYKACRDRAFGYLTGEVSFLDTVAGPKITAFRDNILYPTTSRRMTVDGHMIAIWHGKDMTMKEAAYSGGRSQYRTIEADFLAAAARAKVPVPVFQATLWQWRKRTRGIKTTEQLEVFSGLTRWEEIPDPRDYPPFERAKR